VSYIRDFCLAGVVFFFETTAFGLYFTNGFSGQGFVYKG